MPPLMNNHGNFVGSLGNVCRWLAQKAEALGVEIYPGFAACEILYGANNEVVGIATGDMGVDKHGQIKDSYTRGMELARKIHAVRGRRARLAEQDADQQVQLCRRAAIRRNTASA